ncbi:FAD binding domain-containing protein [Algirhabdus cladophorae]|uniref:FAD binding domain-containing protein n=1 Tax=Algirhabdus cladophorae TaxID=3377108 RepID=UPI003B847DE6
MITVLKNAADIKDANGEIRAGGTDLHDRYRLGVSEGPIIDIHKLNFGGIETLKNGSLKIGANVTIDEVGQSPVVQTGYGALAKAANGLATPQIRWAASLGGSLLQKTRCAYFRHPDLQCTKKGDAACGGREGIHANGVIFDNGGCAHPHPSTLATALLAYDATLVTTDREIPVADLYGDGSIHDRDHLLNTNEILTHVILPPAVDGEKTAYFRSISRFEAEWPIVECSVRLVIVNDHITAAGIGVGGVANVPIRLEAVETVLIGQKANPETLQKSAQVASEGAMPLPQSAWKVDVMENTLLHTLELALAE